MSADDEIKGLLKTYEDLLNVSDVRAAACYTSGGVFILAGLPIFRQQEQSFHSQGVTCS